MLVGSEKRATGDPANDTGDEPDRENSACYRGYLGGVALLGLRAAQKAEPGRRHKRSAQSCMNAALSDNQTLACNTGVCGAIVGLADFAKIPRRATRQLVQVYVLIKSACLAVALLWLGTSTPCQAQEQPIYATAFSRELLTNATLAQWQAALGISGGSSGTAITNFILATSNSLYNQGGAWSTNSTNFAQSIGTAITNSFATLLTAGNTNITLSFSAGPPPQWTISGSGGGGGSSVNFLPSQFATNTAGQICFSNSVTTNFVNYLSTNYGSVLESNIFYPSNNPSLMPVEWSGPAVYRSITNVFLLSPAAGTVVWTNPGPVQTAMQYSMSIDIVASDASVGPLARYSATGDIYVPASGAVQFGTFSYQRDYQRGGFYALHFGSNSNPIPGFGIDIDLSQDSAGTVFLSAVVKVVRNDNGSSGLSYANFP